MTAVAIRPNEFTLTTPRTTTDVPLSPWYARVASVENTIHSCRLCTLPRSGPFRGVVPVGIHAGR